MSERPSRLVPTAVAALKAARKIPWGMKAVFVEDWILDQGPEASWISASNLAARLGMSKDNVEEHRRTLLKLGFYFVVRRAGAKSDGWVPTLPAGCRHHGTTPADIQATAARIDAVWIGQLVPVDQGGARSATHGGAEPTTRGGVGPASDGVVGSANRGGARSATRIGDAPLIQALHQHSSGRQPLVQSGDRERGTRERSHAREQDDQEGAA